MNVSLSLQGLKLRETDIIRIVQDSLDRLHLPDSVTVSIDIAHLPNRAVWIDHDGIVSAIADLATNAVESMPAGGLLTIALEGDENAVTITIDDTGTGIAPEHMDQLFTPFFTTKPVGEGTGLGLPAAYGTVKAHGGDLTLTSNNDPGKGPTGTRIRITLPRHVIRPNPKGTLILHDEDQ